MHTPIIETDRLTLRVFVPEDVDRLAEILGDPSVMRYMPGGEPMPRQRIEIGLKKIIDHWHQHGFGRWAVIHNVDDRLIGWCGLEFIQEISEVEVAYLLEKLYWGKGFATEAAKASLRYGFEELKLDHIIALAFPENVASRRVMEKIGMVYEKMTHIWNLDLVQYRITRETFRSNEHS
jgi:RimJ/RimL family protein N-acetyltransferase